MEIRLIKLPMGAPMIPSKPSMYSLSMSFKESQNPMMYIDTAIELAMVNMIPMAPPNSGPSDLEIM